MAICMEGPFKPAEDIHLNVIPERNGCLIQREITSCLHRHGALAGLTSHFLMGRASSLRRTSWPTVWINNFFMRWCTRYLWWDAHCCEHGRTAPLTNRFATSDIIYLNIRETVLWVLREETDKKTCSDWRGYNTLTGSCIVYLFCVKLRPICSGKNLKTVLGVGWKKKCCQD